MSILTIALRHLEQALIYLACLALFSLMLLIFSDVVLRSAFNAPVESATELTRLLMAIMVFSVLPVVSVRNQHIVVDLLDGFVSNRWLVNVKAAAINLLCGGMLLWPAQRVVVLAERARDYGDVTEYLHIPQFYIAWFIAIMTFVTAILLILKGVVNLVGANRHITP